MSQLAGKASHFDWLSDVMLFWLNVTLIWPNVMLFWLKMLPLLANHLNLDVPKRTAERTYGRIQSLLEAPPASQGRLKINDEEWANEPFKRKEYFNTLDPQGVRDRYRISSSMVSSVRSKYRRLGKSLTCPSCRDVSADCSNTNQTLNSEDKPQPTPRDSQIHIMTECCAYDDLRVKYEDLSHDSNLISFFREVVERRIQNGQD